MIVYFDSSALVKRYVAEPRSEEVAGLFASQPAPITAAITRVEVVAALGRALREKRLDPKEAGEACQVFNREWADFGRVELNEEIAQTAATLAWTHALKAYDAVHLASALRVACHADEPVLMATFDRQLWNAAKAAGLECWPRALD